MTPQTQTARKLSWIIVVATIVAYFALWIVDHVVG